MEQYQFDIRNRETGEIIDSNIVKGKFDKNKFIYLGLLSQGNENYHVYVKDNLGIKISDLGVAIVHGKNHKEILKGISKIEKITKVKFN